MTPELRQTVKRMIRSCQDTIRDHPYGNLTFELEAVATLSEALAQHDRINTLVEHYMTLGRDAEAACKTRRAMAYRSVANMIGAVLQGADPIGVDFLALYPDPPE